MAPPPRRAWRPDRGPCIDKGIRKAIADVGDLAVVQRCQIHKMRNVKGHVSPSRHAYVLREMRDAYKSTSVAAAQRKLRGMVEVRQRLGDILDRVSLRHDQFIIARKGKPLAAVVSVEQLEHLDRVGRGILRDVLERPSVMAQADADRLANEATHRGRRRR